MEFVQSFTPLENRTWTERRCQASVQWLGEPPHPGTPIHIHDWLGQPRVLAADGAPLGTVQARLNIARTGLVRAQVAWDVSKIDVVYLGPDDLAGA